MKTLPVALLALLFVCCSTTKKVPEVDSSKLPAVKFAGLGSKSLRLSVINKRKINEEVGNTNEVAAAVRRSLTEALGRGGLQVTDKSGHSLDVRILDYTGTDAEGECVKVTGVLKAKWGSFLEAEGFACHYLKHFTGISLGGNLSEAYEKAIKMLLDTFEANQARLIGH